MRDHIDHLSRFNYGLLRIAAVLITLLIGIAWMGNVSATRLSRTETRTMVSYACLADFDELCASLLSTYHERLPFTLRPPEESTSLKNRQTTRYIDPLYGYELDVPSTWYIYPTDPSALYGVTVLSNIPDQALEDGTMPPSNAVKVQIGVAPIWATWDFEDWVQGWRANEITSVSGQNYGLTASDIESLTLGRFEGASFIVTDSYGTGSVEILLDMGNQRVMVIILSPASSTGLEEAYDVMRTLRTEHMRHFASDLSMAFAQAPDLESLLNLAKAQSGRAILAATCPVTGTYPGNEAPNAPIRLHMPFRSGQKWQVGGAGSFYGNYLHCNNATAGGDHYATDWNRNDGGVENGADVLPVADGTITKAVWPTCGTGYGCYIVVDHGSNIRTLYAHLSNVYVYDKVGVRVRHWERIGAVGNSGGNFGIHLHLSILEYKNGGWYSRCASNCAPNEPPLSPQTVKPSPMITKERGINTVLEDGESYTSLNGKPGDSNGDGRVNGIDYVTWVDHYGETTTRGPADADFNYDGKVTGMDYMIWVDNYDT